ncbi:DUF6231 family protein [Salinisphaera sp. LB1]|uniref:DUF6231 family protein n=1 Tax=Salinisphaera sp. LB1 TaxID=2183911 RepID=UPI000D707B0C|nr:DUF6231 family protein [Salinisphaera sp. LB1]AWN16946.1 hypothetical protein SALB1_2750 [Salinisphaera sp. LB1]
MTVPDDVRRCLRDEIERYDTTRCVQIAPTASFVDWDELGVSRLVLDPDFDAHRPLSMPTERADLAVVLDAPTVLSRQATRELLGRLRNYAAGAIIAAFPKAESGRDNAWSTSDFLGLGFRRLPSQRAIESAYWLYRYDIFDYKITPDWLNSRYWANPEQWGKRRW